MESDWWFIEDSVTPVPEPVWVEEIEYPKEEAELPREVVAQQPYTADQSAHENAISVDKGDRIFILERFHGDWWFVRKSVTLEEGYVPATIFLEVLVSPPPSDDDVFEEAVVKKAFKADRTKSKKTMSVEPGEVFFKIEQINSDWWFVRNTITFETGYVPAQVFEEPANKPVKPIKEPYVEATIHQAYEADENQHTKALTVSEGQTVYKIQQVNSDWWFVRNTITLEEGYVPVEVFTDVSLQLSKQDSVDGYEEATILRSYEADKSAHEHAISVKKGQRVYKIEQHDSDWWFVRNTVTLEEGYVPADVFAAATIKVPVTRGSSYVEATVRKSYQADKKEHEQAITVSRGDVLFKIEQSTSDWWFVKNTITLEEGYVPAEVFADATVTIQKDDSYIEAIVRKSYKAVRKEHKQAITVTKGEVVFKIEQINSDWWFVRKAVTLEEGYVPADVFQELTVQLERKEDSLEEATVLRSYKAVKTHNRLAMSVSKGDRLYKIEREQDSEWWFVRRLVTLEEGYVPAEVFLEEESSYQEVTVLRSYKSVKKQHKMAMTVTKGEKVYKIEQYDSEWWFVRKVITSEEGYVPATVFIEEETVYQEVTVLRSYKSIITQHKSAMTVTKGEKVYKIEREGNGQWWFVRKVVNSEEGFVPAEVFIAEDESTSLQKTTETTMTSWMTVANVRIIYRSYTIHTIRTRHEYFVKHTLNYNELFE